MRIGQPSRERGCRVLTVAAVLAGVIVGALAGRIALRAFRTFIRNLWPH